MRISAIVAMAENRAIGKNNQLLWHLPDDLKHFKQLTLGKPIVMGRKTHESIGRALPERCNIVISRDVNFNAPGCIVVHSVDEALESAAGQDEIFIIGGAMLYQLFLPKITRIYLTLVQGNFTGDTFFPEIDQKLWHETERVTHAADARNPLSFSFVTLERKWLTPQTDKWQQDTETLQQAGESDNQ